MFDLKMILDFYSSLDKKVLEARKLFKRPLTLTEKILYAHVEKSLDSVPVRQETYVQLNPDRVAMQDATAQMALLQFISAGKKTA
ncbi:MAG: aconitate hydratase, partial [Candidatus Neomarinimicrobiota bacterium]